MNARWHHPRLPEICLLRTVVRWLNGTTLAGLGLVALAACESGDGQTSGNSPAATNGVRLESVRHGKLVDVYGFRIVNQRQVIELYRQDMMVGPDIVDERDADSTRTDQEILYDFISSNPDNLQPRLLITRQIGAAEFEAGVEALDDNLRLVSPSYFGKDVSLAPYSIIPRNAAIVLTFDGDLGITDDFFYEKDNLGKIIGVKNTQAIQLLQIASDPNDQNPVGDFIPIDVRLIVRGDQLILDPVLLGAEGLQFGSRNNASGLPESPDQLGANIRIAIAIDGPLKLPGVHEDKSAQLNNHNNDGLKSVIRDFRSGNAADNSAECSRGFLRDPHPPRLIGEMLMYLVRVETINAEAKLITIYKDGIHQELDRGDLLRMFVDASGVPIASIELLDDPTDDLGKPEFQRVRAVVRPVLNAAGEDLLELIDPSNRADFPPHANEEQEEWLRKNAPRAVLVCEYTHRRLHPIQPSSGPRRYYGDDPRNFLSFSPRPLPNDKGVTVNNDNVSPFAGAVLRFSKPINLSTIIASDTAFFATRNVLDKAAIDEFINSRGIEPSTFDEDKFRTPHLIQGQVFDENGSQITIRIQPTLGFYLDQAMRDAATADQDKPFDQRRYHYFLHVMSGLRGISDLAGNPLDFQAASDPDLEIVENVVIEFALDTRKRGNTEEPRYHDNIVIYLVRRFAGPDEDEKPNYYLPNEITPVGRLTPPDAWRSDDLFGSVSFLPSGELIGRAATRTRKVVDNMNQQSPPPQTTALRWCPITAPTTFNSPLQIVNRTAGTVFGQPVRNPVNPFGCRLQMTWREIDMSLSRTDPLDFNLDVEQLYWAPFTQNAIVFDEFDRVTLYLGHGEFRPEPCISSGDAFPSMPSSGLDRFFEKNYAHNIGADGKESHKVDRHPAFIDAILTINTTDAILETNGVNRYLPLPKFIDASKTTNLRNPYFVWRDEQEIVQGGVNGLIDTSMTGYPYLLSPFLGGLGNRVINPSGVPGQNIFLNGGWYNAGYRNGTRNHQLRNGRMTDAKTDGCVGAIALPLLADFWVYPDDPDLPSEGGFLASGINGWQVSLSVTSSAQPNFRVYSAGRVGTGNQVDPTSSKWQLASGGWTPDNRTTPLGDNTMYWTMADFLKRTTVVTSGFVDIANPHRMPTGGDPRLGPYDVTGKLPTYTYGFEPHLSTLPPGTGVVTEFRGASQLTRPNQWWPPVGTNVPTVDNFPLDPLKAGDAHIHHWDTRNIRGTSTPRRWFSYLYNDTVTSYTENPNDLADSDFTNTFSGPSEAFNASEVKYFNWRFILKSNVEVAPPVSPKIQSFSCAYRLSDR